MAGDWIKWTKGLPDKPEVFKMAGQLGLPREVIVCKLMRFWEWADEHIPVESITGSTAVLEMSPRDGDNRAAIDAIVAAAGFADALAAVGWVQFSAPKVLLPNFGRHNGETAKTRARNASSKRRLRSKVTPPKPPPSPPSPPNVPTMSSRDGDRTRTRGEREIEESKKAEEPPTPTPTAALVVPADPIPTALDTPDFRAAWADWLADRKARRKAVTDRGAKQQLAALAPLGPVKAAECIRLSITNGWTGLFPERFLNSPGASGSPIGGRTDFQTEYAKKTFLDAYRSLQPGGGEDAE